MKNILTTPHAPRTIAEAGLLRSRGSLYMESRIDEQLGILPEEARRVRSVMCSALTVVSPDTSLGEAVSVMRAMNVPVLVVYEGRRLVGMVTEHEMAVDQSGGVKPKHGVVASLMRPDPPYCREDDLLAEAHALMRLSELDWMPVLDHAGRLAGVLSIYVRST